MLVKKLKKTRFSTYRKQIELANFLSEISFSLEIDKKTTKKVLYLSEISRKFLKASDSLVWFLVFYICLVLKTEEKNGRKSNSVSIHQKNFAEKHFSSYFSLFRGENEKIVPNFKTLVFFIENFILKVFRFKVHFRFAKHFYPPFWKKLGFLKKDFFPIVSNFRSSYYPKKIIKVFLLTPFLTHSSLKCFFVSKVWFAWGENPTLYPWWRFFKIRECEMEFFEQKAILECCSTMNRKNLNKNKSKK